MRIDFAKVIEIVIRHKTPQSDNPDHNSNLGKDLMIFMVSTGRVTMLVRRSHTDRFGKMEPILFRVSCPHSAYCFQVFVGR